MKNAEELRKDVLIELAWDTSLDAAAIGVAATDGAVTLSGHVRSYAEKRAAEKAARRVRGVMAVANDLEVRVPDGLQRDDTDIATAVVSAITWNVGVPNAVTAIVEKGWVTLDGDVERAAQRRSAERAVRDLIGVRGVTNLIRLQPRPAPADVKEQIERAFHRSAQIDADHVSVTMRNGTVVLTGTVRSWSERMEAEHAARAAAGVEGVDNQLHIAGLVPAM